MKKTLVLGVSTAIMMTTLTGCVFDRPVTTKYGIDPPDNQSILEKFDTPVPEVYGANPDSNSSANESNKAVPVVYGPSTSD